ncbi:TatD family hydrolase [Patescibacteria group bacterium]|nr:TatD family hydrolase [Patescibacteria group bacterium]
MLIDSHCHIPHKKYEMPPDQIIKEANLAGVEKMISIGTSIKDNEDVISLSDKYACVFHTVGIYPHDDLDHEVPDLKEILIKQINKSGKAVGIGECGIDVTNWKGGRSLEDQEALFEMQIKLAKEYRLPLVIHNRNGDAPVFKLLNDTGVEWLRGVSHCFSSSWETAEKFLDLGFYLSFSGNTTYPSAKSLREVVKKVPLEMFILETDSPYLPPQEHRGKINYPKYVKIVAEEVAQVKQKSLEEIEKFSYENTCRLFNLL